MSEDYLLTLLFLVVAGFLAAFIDSVVGGGGVISLPALMATGLPPHIALGTNKFVGTLASFTSTLSFLRGKSIHLPLMVRLFAFSFIGAFFGANAATLLPGWTLKWIVAGSMLVIGIYTLLKKDLGSEERFAGWTKGSLLMGVFVSFVIGFYDGILGPGTGSFFLFFFLRYYGFGFLKAAGNGRILNFASNIGSLIVFIFKGKVLYMLALPMGVAMIAGAYAGSRMAIVKGSKYIRLLFILVTFALLVKLLYDLL